MAIQFARIARVKRSEGKNACCKGAYNARTVIKDEKTNIVYNFAKRGGNVYHKILLPDYVDTRFKNLSELMNTIEHIEKKSDSQLLKEFVLALPDEDNISLEIKEEMVHEFIRQNNWIQEGLGVVIDIHEPHEDEKNWHAHLLVTTRRFTKDGQRLGLKARDLDPQVRGGRTNTYVKSNEEINLGKLWATVQNQIFKNHNLENRVDSIGVKVQEHIGPIRMRSVLNEAASRNEERRLAEIEHLSNGACLLDKVTRSMSVFSKDDLIRAVKYISDAEVKDRLVEDALSHKSVVALYNEDGTKAQYFTTTEVRLEEEKILRLSGYVSNLDNIFKSSNRSSYIDGHLKEAAKILSNEQYIALSELVNSNSGLSILRGRAGVGGSLNILLRNLFL